MKTFIPLLFLIPSLSWGSDDLKGKNLFCEIENGKNIGAVVIQFLPNNKARVDSLYAQFFEKLEHASINLGGIYSKYKTTITNISLPWGYQHNDGVSEYIEYHGIININRMELTVDIRMTSEPTYENGTCRIITNDDVSSYVEDIKSSYEIWLRQKDDEIKKRDEWIKSKQKI